MTTATSNPKAELVPAAPDELETELGDVVIEEVVEFTPLRVEEAEEAVDCPELDAELDDDDDVGDVVIVDDEDFEDVELASAPSWFVGQPSPQVLFANLQPRYS
jgi:hypothetical protein